MKNEVEYEGVIMIVEETTHKVEAVVHKKKEKKRRTFGLFFKIINDFLSFYRGEEDCWKMTNQLINSGFVVFFGRIKFGERGILAYLLAS